eukprot:scaffold29332_cov52-Phaeocystis_antarctica.AAC.3
MPSRAAPRISKMCAVGARVNPNSSRNSNLNPTPRAYLRAPRRVPARCAAGARPTRGGSSTPVRSTPGSSPAAPG